jgi:thiazole/oxazole-forming peptide maturase SagD family component
MPDTFDSRFTGLFTRIGPLARRAHDPALALHAAQAAAWRDDLAPVDGGGVGWDDAAAEAAAVGEAVERLQAYPLPQDHVVEASFADWPLDEPAIGPGRWVLFHEEQYRQAGFPYRPFEPTTRCRWTCCRQVLTGEPMWVPADLVYLHPPRGQTQTLCPGLSTGLASGRAGDPVVLRGLQEVIERDAVVGMWWGRYPLCEIHPERVWTLLGTRADDVRRPNLRWRFLRIASPFSDHVTLATLEGEDREGPLFSIGSACRETWSASITKSLLEAVHGRHYVRWLKQQHQAGRFVMGEIPRTFAEHAAYDSVGPRQQNTPLTAAKIISDDGNRDRVESLADMIERLGPERPELVRNMTAPALVGLGWQVARVVVPGLQPLHGHHQLAHLGGPLWHPRGLGEYAAMPSHPFP